MLLFHIKKKNLSDKINGGINMPLTDIQFQKSEWWKKLWSMPDLPGCITSGETIEAAVANAVDAKKAWIEAALEEGIEINGNDRRKA